MLCCEVKTRTNTRRNEVCAVEPEFNVSYFDDGSQSVNCCGRHLAKAIRDVCAENRSGSLRVRLLRK